MPEMKKPRKMSAMPPQSRITWTLQMSLSLSSASSDIPHMSFEDTVWVSQPPSYWDLSRTYEVIFRIEILPFLCYFYQIRHRAEENTKGRHY